MLTDKEIDAERAKFEAWWPDAELPQHMRNGYTAGDVERAEKDAAQEAWLARAVLAALEATPRYTTWMHLRTHGQWPDTVPTWARDHNGQMNDGIAAHAVIEELAGALAAVKARLGAKEKQE